MSYYKGWLNIEQAFYLVLSQFQNEYGLVTRAVTSVEVMIRPSPRSFTASIIFLCIAQAILIYSVAHSAVSGLKME